MNSQMPLKNIKALVVEDQPAEIEGTLLSLKRIGLTYQNVTDLESAEQELQKQNFDFVIIDLKLPQHKGEAPTDDAGVRLIRELQEGVFGSKNVDKPFLILSAQNKSIAQKDVDKRGNCWGIYGKLMHNRILSEVQRRAAQHFSLPAP